MLNSSFARALRGHRLHRHDDQNLLIVPLDHSVTNGPVTGGRHVDRLIGTFADSGADAVVVHKGTLRYVDPIHFRSMALVVHLSASTAHAPDPDAKHLVTGVGEAVRLGADAVSVHVNIGSAGEPEQLRDLGSVAAACDRRNVPLLAMMYLRGPRIVHPKDPELVAHAVILAADLGADIVKVPDVEPDTVRDVARISPLPIVVAGGPRRGDEDELVGHVGRLLDAGAAGLAMGRNLFEAPDPGALARRIAARVHAESGRAGTGLRTVGAVS